MKPKLHYYNPGHETAALQGANYTPPVNVRRMLSELALLPVWYADKGDYVYTEQKAPRNFLSLLPEEIRPDVTIFSSETSRLRTSSFPEMLAAPWGLSLQSIEFYTNLMNRYKVTIELPVWKDDYVTLTGRQTGAACFKKIRQLLPDVSFPSPPLFFSKLPDIEAWLYEHPETSVVKTPYSSSGRGLLWLNDGILKEKDRNWIKGALRKQGSVSIEPALDASRNFAMEFFIDKQGNVRYEGLSVFDTSPKGAYRGNRLAVQDDLENTVSFSIGKTRFQQVKEAAAEAVGEIYAGYSGYLGVDMLVYKTAKGTNAIHPCIEVNLRYTMGMAAIRLFEKYIHPDAHGVFDLLYEAEPEMATQVHRKNKKEYPLTFKDGKLRCGYLSLCPVTKQTHYIAYLIIQ
ncbi:MAG: hypothetical protein LBJ60_05710 [Tannerellaceae bacterium]|jgi:hypothetical protein|nr:hypothetical protein [Tannerellaceae bacterium]